LDVEKIDEIVLTRGSIDARFESADLGLLEEIADLFSSGAPVTYGGVLHLGKEISDYSDY